MANRNDDPTELAWIDDFAFTAAEGTFPLLGTTTEVGNGWLFAFRHGTFLFPFSGSTTAAAFFFDLLNGPWFFTNADVYPWTYYFTGGERSEGWHLFFESSEDNLGFRIWFSTPDGETGDDDSLR